MRRHPAAAASALLALAALAALAAYSLRPAAAVSPPPEVEHVAGDIYRVGDILVDTAARTVTCSGVVGMNRGYVEYLAVTPEGKTYESVLRLSARPIHLQVALLLLGLQPENVLKRQGDPATPRGAPVSLTLKWQGPHGSAHSEPAEDLLRDGKTGKPMERHSWVFTGSRILPAGFEADLTGSVIAVWHDPAAMVDDPIPGGAQNVWEVNTARTPPPGTGVQLVLQAAPQPTGGVSAGPRH